VEIVEEDDEKTGTTVFLAVHLLWRDERRARQPTITERRPKLPKLVRLKKHNHSSAQQLFFDFRELRKDIVTGQ
jgi:hypothetical protein